MGGNCPTHSGSLFSLPVYPGSRQKQTPKADTLLLGWDDPNSGVRTVVSGTSNDPRRAAGSSRFVPTRSVGDLTKLPHPFTDPKSLIFSNQSQKQTPCFWAPVSSLRPNKSVGDRPNFPHPSTGPKFPIHSSRDRMSPTAEVSTKRRDQEQTPCFWLLALLLGPCFWDLLLGWDDLNGGVRHQS